MPVTLNIIESTTALGQEVVEVVLASASTPGPAGPGVPTGGTANQVLTKDSGTDYDTSWQDAQGGAAALDDLTDVALTAPQIGDRLEFDGADWVNTASAAVGPHHTSHENGGTDEVDVTGLSGVLADPQTPAAHAHAGEDITSGTVADARIASTIARDSEVSSAIAASEAGQVRDGDAAGGVLGGTYPNPSFAADMATQAELDAHITDTSAAHAATAISADSTTLSGTGADVQAVLEELDNLLDDHSARHENGGADEISIAGLDGTPTELTNHLNDTSAAHAASAISADSTTLVGTGTDVQAVLEELDNGIADHLADTSAAHAASAISFTPAGTIAATDVQAAIEEVASEAGGSGVPDLQWETRSSNTILGVADKGKAIAITASITQTFEADETLGDGWWVILHNAGTVSTVIVTLDPAGAETIDGATTLKLYAGEQRIIYCNGSGGNFNSVTLAEGPIRSGGYTPVVKLSDESFATDTTPTLDSELFFPSVAGATYEVELLIYYASPDGGGTPDIKFNMGEDTSPRGIGVMYALSTSGAAQVASIIFDTDTTSSTAGTDVVNRLLKITGVYWDAAGGNFGLLWSQNTSNANPTIVRAGSVLRYRRIK